MGISLSKAYEIIRELNSELKEMGYLVVRGKVSRAYFQEKCLYKKEGCDE
nr:DNA-binding protein [Anaerostipes hominis (ex Lee et al. 2021)]